MAAPTRRRAAVFCWDSPKITIKNLEPVKPVAPVAPYLGGKRNLAKRITAIIDQVPHLTYAEPFVGMGGIFLRRSMRPRAEVINDYGQDVSNLFRILQRHYPQFLEVLRFQITTRTEFNRLVDTDPSTLTDLERAARFLYLQRTTFGGKPSGRYFGVSKEDPARFNLSKLDPMLEDLHARLSGVVIECLGYGEFIDRPFKCEVPHLRVAGQVRKDYLFGANQEVIHAQKLSSPDP